MFYKRGLLIYQFHQIKALLCIVAWKTLPDYRALLLCVFDKGASSLEEFGAEATSRVF